jgi:hypothetical protein
MKRSRTITPPTTYGGSIVIFRIHWVTMATKHVAVRLDEQTLARVDALIPALSTPWRQARRSDVLRALIHGGLVTEERRVGAAPGKQRRAKR